MQTPTFDIYNASAGAGKTYALVKEYIKILLRYEEDDAFKHILSITFTNKAVNEMKERILKSLEHFSVENTPAQSQSMLDDIVSETQKSQQYVKQKCKRILKKIVHNYAAFDVSTIDKFNNRIVRSFANEIGIPMSFEISLETDKLLTESIDSLVSKVGKEQYQDLTDTLINFAVYKSEENKSWDVSNELKEVGKMTTEELHFQELSAYKEYTLSEFEIQKKKIRERISQIEIQQKDKAEEILKYLQAEGIDRESFSGQYFPKHIEKLAKGERPADLKYGDEEAIKFKKGKEASLEVRQELASRTREVYKMVTQKAFLQEVLKKIIPFALVNEIAKEIAQKQKEQDIVSISEINKIINEEIKNQPALYIYEKMGEKYQHFFIDEFQDTSEMQWENIIPLIENALSGQNDKGKAGSLMIVGDPKQSIYRFRGGKTEQFIDLSSGKNPFANVEEKVLNLDTNYRSYSEIIEFNNLFFQYISQYFQNPVYEEMYKNNSFQKANDKQGGLVSLSLIRGVENKKESEEKHIEKILSTIAELLTQGYSYSDIVILVAKNAEGVLVANKLTENEIPIISSESLLLKNSEYVQILINVLQWILNPKDLQSKVQLLYLLAKEKQSADIHKIIVGGLSKQADFSFEEYLKKIDYKFDLQKAINLPLYELVEYCIQTFIPKHKDNAFVQFFLDEIYNQSINKQSGLIDFINYWKNHSHKLSISLPEDIDAVRIMTIHKSKGLQFPVVIYPFVEKDFSRSNETIWVPLDEKSIEISKIYLPVKKDVENYSNKAQEIYKNHKEIEKLDAINRIYVAFTRACERLYIISSNTRSNQFFSYLEDFVKEKREDFSEDKEEYNFGEKTPKQTKKNTKPKNQPKYTNSTTQKIKSEVVKIATNESIMWDNGVAQSIEKGNIVHELLKNIVNKEDIENAIEKGIIQGIISHSEKTQFQQMIEKVVNRAELSDFFSGKGRVVTETPFLKKGEKTIKPDRVVIQGKDVYLLDYKTGVHKESHKKQLEKYQQALQEMNFSVKKKILVYLQNEIEIIAI